MAAPLAPVELTRVAQRITRRGLTRPEAWEAVTTDGEWVFEREEAAGTSWLVIHRETGDVVDQMSTLRGCRWYVAAGHAQAQLELRQAHERGEHAGRVPSCGRC